ncbi:MAG: hypothetical protein MAG451_00331 [Anaerolineales bacterium]|nr:hypothetical protein [Anaerolineales bacterium]
MLLSQAAGQRQRPRCTQYRGRQGVERDAVLGDGQDRGGDVVGERQWTDGRDAQVEQRAFAQLLAATGDGGRDGNARLHVTRFFHAAAEDRLGGSLEGVSQGRTDHGFRWHVLGRDEKRDGVDVGHGVEEVGGVAHVVSGGRPALTRLQIEDVGDAATVVGV